MEKVKCERFCNGHCSSSDCPNIQYDMVNDKWGYGIAEDIGLERVRCSECCYNDNHCTCNDCYFQGGKDCLKFGGDNNAAD